ncbi:hypothetical protein [Streptomyces sp. NPDC086787]|uniref:hypothetical protein n=1 Tax=Streptomyces sp. NPDC086787 TaxID=3365759 RepID=UPI0037F61242
MTQQELSEAQAAVEAAELKLDRAEAHHARAGSEQAVTELRAARADAHAARDWYRSLAARFAREQAAGRARETAEASFPEKERKAVTRRLEKARDEAVAALVEAERVAGRLLAAVAAYEGVVRETAAGLKARGLAAGEGGEDGGTAGGVVHLGGEVWRPADAPSLLASVARSAVAARDPRHPVARWRQVVGLPDRAAQVELMARAAVR